jgi:hypothetical protein
VLPVEAVVEEQFHQVRGAPGRAIDEDVQTARDALAAFAVL